jgi:thymidine phosphorylase
MTLGAEMLIAGGVADDTDAAAARIAAALDDGSALERFRRVVEAQGGDPAVCDEPERVLPRAAHRVPVPAPRSGYVTAVATDEVGIAALVLGAGRRRREDGIDPAVGIELAVRIGDRLDAGEPLGYLHHNDVGADDAARRLVAAYTLADAPTTAAPLILEVMR